MLSWFLIGILVGLCIRCIVKPHKIVFDVLSSPILIVMRVVRWLLAKFVNEHVKNFIKKIVHWFIDNRKIRLQKRQNIFRYYWYLWLLSPVILLVLVLVLAFTTGVLEGLKEI